MSTSDQRKGMAELLEDVANRKIAAEDALEQTKTWPEALWKEKILADAWHALKHFEIDSDVSAESIKFAQHQTKSLLSWAKLLRETL